MIIIGVPVLKRYDLLGRFLMSVYRSRVQPDKIVVVDNGGKFRESELGLPDGSEVMEPGFNVGVSAAWNMIIERARELGSDRVVISNDDIELSEDALGAVLSEDADVVRAPGYSFFALRTKVIDRVGWFDEQFFPGYYEDVDFHHRIRLAGLSVSDPQGLGIEHVGSATLHTLSDVQQATFGSRFMELREYYAQKWGGHAGQETFPEPFGGNPPTGWQERPITVGGQQMDDQWFR